MFLQNLSMRSKGILSIVGGCLLHLLVGSGYIWGTINIYCTSFYRLLANPTMTTSIAVVVSPASDIIGSISMLFTDMLTNKFGSRGSALLMTLLLFGSTIACAHMPSFFTFILFYGFLNGGIMSQIWVIPIYNAYSFFPKQKGLTSGIILCGVGIGTLVANFLVQELINPDNLIPTIKGTYEYYFDEEVAWRFPFGIQILAVYFLVVGLIGSFFLFNYDKKVVTQERLLEVAEMGNDTKFEQTEQVSSLKARNEEKKQALLENQDDNLNDSNLSDQGLSLKEALKTKDPYLLTATFMLAVTAICFLEGNYKNYGILHLKDDQYLTLVGSVAGIANGFSRIVFGKLGDKYGFKKILLIVLSMQTFFFATMVFVVTSKPLYMVWNVGVYLSLGGMVPMMPAICSHIFTNKHTSSKIFAIVNIGGNLGNTIQFLFVYYFVTDFGFEIFVYGSAVVSFLSVVLMYYVRD